MFKKVFFAAALMMASSPIVSAQDFFFSFDQNSRATTQTVSAGTTSATAFLFADENVTFNAADLDFSISGATVSQVPSVDPMGNPVVDGMGNPVLVPSVSNAVPNTSGFTSLAFVNFAATASGEDATFFATSFNAPALGLFAPGQVAGTTTPNFVAGANGFLLGQVDFDIIAGETQVDFQLEVGDLGVGSEAGPLASVNVGTSTLTVEGAAAIPEPSSAMLLILGAAGMVARRRRS